MSTRGFGIPEVIVRLALTVTVLFTAGNVYAQSLRVAAANSSSDNDVYDVFFSPISTLLLNSDSNPPSPTYTSFHSLVYVPNPSSLGGVDLVAADTGRGTIVRYFAPTGTPTVGSTLVYTFTDPKNCSGNSNNSMLPDGLSVDSSNNLYLVTNCPGPQLWVLPASSPPVAGVLPPVLPPATGFSAPVPLNPNVNTEVDSFVETVVVPSTLPNLSTLNSNGIHAGDLLVLVSDNDGDATSDSDEKALVLDFAQGSLGCRSDCGLMPTIVLTESQFPYSKSSSPPLPVGMDFWPADGSLLISTNADTILQYALGIVGWPPAESPPWTIFASLPSPCAVCTAYQFYKLRTGAQVNSATGVNTAYAFVTQSTGPAPGNILEFASPMSVPSSLTTGFRFTSATVTVPATVETYPPTIPPTYVKGIPQGLAVAPPGSAVVASLAGCTTGPCTFNPTGGLGSTITGSGTGNVTGEILQNTCVIADTRVKPNGTCPGTLTISNANYPKCHFLPNTSYRLLATICGASMSTQPDVNGTPINGNALAVIQTVAPGAEGIANIVVDSAQMPSALIPGATDPVCLTSPGQIGTTPQQVVAWAPSADEGTQPEGNSTITDVTGYCDGGHGSSQGPSLFVIGGRLSSAVTSSKLALVLYTDAKLVLLGDVVYSASIATGAQKLLGACLAKATGLLNTGKFGPAATQISMCYSLVETYASSFGSSTAYPNSLGDVLSRLQTVYYLMNTLISSQPTVAPLE